MDIEEIGASATPFVEPADVMMAALQSAGIMDWDLEAARKELPGKHDDNPDSPPSATLVKDGRDG